MKHARAKTIGELMELVRTFNDKVNDEGEDTKIAIYPMERKNGVSICFEYYNQTRRRESARQIARKIYDKPNIDLTLEPETNTNIYNSNVEKLKTAKDLWKRLSVDLKDGKLKGGKRRKNDITLFNYINSIIDVLTRQGKSISDKKSLLKHLEQSGMLETAKSKPLQQIDKTFCTKFFDYLVNDSGLQGKTPHNVAQQLSIVLNRAVDDELILSNPCKNVPKSHKPKLPAFDNTKFMKIEQVAVLAEFFNSLPIPKSPQYEQPKFRLWESTRIFLFACYAGLRISDIEQLTPDMIVSDGEHTFIAKTIQKTQTPTLKPLNDDAVALLSLTDNKRHLFYYIEHNTLRYNIRKVVKMAGIELHFRPSPHTGRHSFATNLLETGTPLPTVQLLMDHKTAQTTMCYAGVTQKMAIDAVNKLSPKFLQSNSLQK